jgi:DNA adenine methylase
MRAARMIYLNRTCFNGMYRVSLAGKFNVPKGTRSSVLLSTDNFKGVARVLRNAELLSCDFEQVIDRADQGDFVFADPPYTVNHNNNGFIRYNENLFSWRDQQRLAAALARARDRGAIVIATNAAHGSIKKLYWKFGFNVRSVYRFSSISSTAINRKQFGEIIIRSKQKGGPT